MGIPDIPSPPFLILFINSVCNLRCGHCFYWENLNQRDDLTLDEIMALSDELGKVENLNLSGGEPFLRREFAEICRYFIRNNQVEQIYVPTNAYYTDRTIQAISGVLQESRLKVFAVEISLDGMAEYHNRFRGSDQSFQKSMETYDALAELQKSDPRLRIHAVSTVTADNIDEVRKLTRFLYERCPAMDHHNIALIRGGRKNPSLLVPNLDAYEELYMFTRQLWSKREDGRFGGIVEPMLQWAKMQTAKEKRQVVPCCAGVLSAVVYANGDVGLCEMLPPVGNLRGKRFREIWHSEEAAKVRRSIQKKDCYCTNEIFLWPSITFQPLQLIKGILHSGVWKKDAYPVQPPLINSWKEKS